MCASLLLPVAKLIPVSKIPKYLSLIMWRAPTSPSSAWLTSFMMLRHALVHRNSKKSSGALQVHELRPEMLADARARLVSGLKRYFHQKRIEGLLSSTVSAVFLTAAGRLCMPSFNSCLLMPNNNT